MLSGLGLISIGAALSIELGVDAWWSSPQSAGVGTWDSWLVEVTLFVFAMAAMLGGAVMTHLAFTERCVGCDGRVETHTAVFPIEYYPSLSDRLNGHNPMAVTELRDAPVVEESASAVAAIDYVKCGGCGKTSRLVLYKLRRDERSGRLEPEQCSGPTAQSGWTTEQFARIAVSREAFRER